jgi:hypothetical protein
LLLLQTLRGTRVLERQILDVLGVDDQPLGSVGAWLRRDLLAVAGGRLHGFVPRGGVRAFR